MRTAQLSPLPGPPPALMPDEKYTPGCFFVILVDSSLDAAVPLRVEALCRLGKKPLSAKVFLHSLAEVCLRVPGAAPDVLQRLPDVDGGATATASGDLVWCPPAQSAKLSQDLDTLFTLAGEAGVAIEALHSEAPAPAPAPSLPASGGGAGAASGTAMPASMTGIADTHQRKAATRMFARATDSSCPAPWRPGWLTRLCFPAFRSAAPPLAELFESHVNIQLVPDLHHVREAADALGTQLANLAVAL